MKTYEKVMEPARERVQLKDRTCDLCGVKAKNADQWGPGTFDVSETEQWEGNRSGPVSHLLQGKTGALAPLSGSQD